MDVGKLPALIWSLCWMCTFVDKQGQREEGRTEPMPWRLGSVWDSGGVRVCNFVWWAG